MQHSQPRSDNGEPVTLSWVGSPWEFTSLSYINFLLSVVTLGVYSFWGRTEVRRRLWSSIRLQGEPFVYTGTGGELFKGFLFAIAVFFLPILAVSIGIAVIVGPESPINDLVALLVYVVIFLLMGIAIYRARRYRLTRTQWRGIRGGMSGSPKSFAWLWVWTSLLVAVTAGWFAPQRAIEIQKRLHNETTFGDQKFTFVGDSGPLYPPFAVLWCGIVALYLCVIAGSVLIIGLDVFAMPDLAGTFQPSRRQIAAFIALVFSAILVWSVLSSWYQARKLMLFAKYTTFDKAGFGLQITGLGLIGLVLTNTLIKIISLGVLGPVTQVRTFKYFVDRLQMHGTIDFQRIAQGQLASGGVGEGLAQAFDVDAF